MHHWARADNARFAAFALSRLPPEDLNRLQAALPYGGTPHIAIHEAFLREAALALELILKAVVAARIEGGTAPSRVVRVRLTHDVLKLWEEDAGLPELPREDRMTLAIAASILLWAGRYAAPAKDEVYEFETERDELIDPPPAGGKIRIRKGRSISWDQFDRVYAVAAAEFWRLHDGFSHRDPGATGSK